MAAAIAPTAALGVCVELLEHHVVVSRWLSARIPPGGPSPCCTSVACGAGANRSCTMTAVIGATMRFLLRDPSCSAPMWILNRVAVTSHHSSSSGVATLQRCRFCTSLGYLRVVQSGTCRTPLINCVRGPFDTTGTHTPTAPRRQTHCLACLHTCPRVRVLSTAAPARRLPRATCVPTHRTAAAPSAYPHRHRRRCHLAPHPAPSPYTTRAPHVWRAVSRPLPHTRGVYPSTVTPRPPSCSARRTATFQRQN